MADQSDTKSQISYCVTASSHIIHTGTHEHHSISSTLTHIPLLGRVSRKCARMRMCLHQTPSNACVSRTPTFKVNNWYKISRLTHE